MEHSRSKGDQDPNRAANMEPAEGSRDTVRNSERPEDRRESGGRSGRGPDTAPASEGSRGSGSGITNREPTREQEEQSHLPPRGGTREDR